MYIIFICGSFVQIHVNYIKYDICFYVENKFASRLFCGLPQLSLNYWWFHSNFYRGFELATEMNFLYLPPSMLPEQPPWYKKRKNCIGCVLSFLTIFLFYIFKVYKNHQPVELPWRVSPLSGTKKFSALPLMEFFRNHQPPL